MSTAPALLRRAEALLAACRSRGWRIATAESCTGGLVAALLTEIAGSSDVVECGFVTYSNDAKAAMLGVDPVLIAAEGAVSEEVARAMAEGALARSGVDLAVSITGIAGPSGGSEKKPVGTVVFARSIKGEDPEKAKVDQRGFGDLGRSGIRLQAALCALELLLPDGASA